jgi:hypothetical protein
LPIVATVEFALLDALMGICPVCNTCIYRRISIARLPAVRGELEVQITQPQPRIADTADPRVDCHYGQEVKP